MSIAQPVETEPTAVTEARAAYAEAVERNRAAMAAGQNLPIGRGALGVLQKRLDAALASN